LWSDIRKTVLRYDIKSLTYKRKNDKWTSSKFETFALQKHCYKKERTTTDCKKKRFEIVYWNRTYTQNVWTLKLKNTFLNGLKTWAQTLNQGRYIKSKLVQDYRML
jgi:hypothetical protein